MHDMEARGGALDWCSNRNEYEEYFLTGKGGRSAGLTLPPSCADRHEIWEPEPPGTMGACPGLVHGLLYLYLFMHDTKAGRPVVCKVFRISRVSVRGLIVGLHMNLRAQSHTQTDLKHK